jgi:hypothetical protein
LDEQRLVVRLHDPRRFRVLVVVAVVLALALGVGLYELGHRGGGQSSLQADQRRQALRAEVARLTVENQQLKEDLARSLTSQEVDREAQSRLHESLAATEARVAELNEELAFYRRIVTPPDGQTGLRVQTFEVTPTSLANGYRLRLLLVQSPQRSGRAQGQMELSLHGTLNGEEASLTLVELAAEPQGFEFLYFQDVDLDVVLPQGFEPQVAEVQLRHGQRANRVVAASFPWKPKG